MKVESRPELHAATVESERFAPGVLLVLSSGAAWYTFRGLLLELSGRSGGPITAAMVALVVGVALFACWRTLLRTGPLLPGAARKTPPLIVLCLVLGIGTSGTFSFMGIEGPEAARIFMDRGAASLAASFAITRRFVAENALSAFSLIEAVHAKLGTSATAARNGVTIAGGTGAVSVSYQQLGDAAATALDQIKHREDQVATLAREIDGDLAKLDELLSDVQVAPSERFVRYHAAVHAIYQKIERLADLDVTPIVAGAHAALSSVLSPPLSAKSEIAEQQKKAIDKLKAELPTLLTAELLPRPTFVAPDTGFTVFDAVLDTWQHFVPVAVAIVLIEITPLFFLIVSLMATPHLSDADAILNQTVRALLLGEEAMRRLGAAPTPRPSLLSPEAATVTPPSEKVEPTCYESSLTD
jgi:hypothetical protein